MRMDDHTTGRNQFDENLLMALLERDELFNEQNNEAMATQLFTAGTVPVLENAAVLEKLHSAFGRKNKYKWWLNIFILLLVGGVTVFLVSKPWESEPMSAGTGSSQPAPESQSVVAINGAQVEERNIQRGDEMVMPVTDDSVFIEEKSPGEMVTPAYFGSGHTNYYIPEPIEYDEEEIPILTDAQKKRNNKRKLSMFREIAKKKSFTLVPGGNAWRNGMRYNVNTFYLQGSEVSNWMYNLFLHDLISDGKTADYLACKPVKGNWKAVGIPEFENTYATSEGYEKFPVLNIPRNGAEMYCKWLTTEMNEAIDNKDVKWTEDKRPDFRLPSDIEWLRAARGDHDSTMQFPWGYRVNALQNSKGCYLCNFNYGISKDVLTPIESDGKNCISMKATTRAVVTTAGRSIDTLVLGPEYCYNPTDFGHYCMMGNAAEMVWTWDDNAVMKKGAPRAMGGSWYSHADEVRIESKQQFEGITEGNVNIGFRVVMTYR